MPILDAEELAELRSDVAEVLEEVYPDTGTLKRPGEPVRNSTHPEVAEPGLATIQEAIPCKYRASTPREMVVAEKGDASTSYTFEVPGNIDIRNEDVFIVDAKGEDPEMTFDVTGAMLKSNALKKKFIASLRTDGDDEE